MNYELEELIPLVGWLSERATAKESSSITYELANQLMEAVIYCINAWENQCSLGGSLEKDGGLPAAEAYRLGYELVLSQVHEAKKRYDRVVKQFVSFSNRTYEDTVIKGMPEFFLRYNPRLCPQDHLLLLDYPVLVNLEHQTGIHRISEYLSCIETEQQFLKKLPPAYINRVLTSYHKGHRNLVMNLSGVVIRSLLGFSLADMAPDPQGYQPETLKKAETRIGALSQEELEAVLNQELARMTGSGSSPVYEYLNMIIPDFAVELKNARDHGVLSTQLF